MDDIEDERLNWTEPVQTLLVNKMPPLHLAAQSKGGIEAMEFISMRNGYAAATNGFVISVVPLTPLFDEQIIPLLEGKYINASAWKYLYDEVKKNWLPVVVHHDKIVINIDDDHTHVLAMFTDETLDNERIKEGNGKFPNWQDMWNRAAEKANDPDVFEHWVSLKPSLLDLVAKIMGSPTDGVRIRPTGDGQPILISSAGTDWGDMYAIIMPMTKNQLNFEFTKVTPYNPKF